MLKALIDFKVPILTLALLRIAIRYGSASGPVDGIVTNPNRVLRRCHNLYLLNSCKVSNKKILPNRLPSSCKQIHNRSQAGMNRRNCAKNVQIRSFFWSVFSRIWTEYGDL